MSKSSSPGFWTLAPERVDLGENEVHVWSILMDDAGLCFECYWDLLSLEEGERASRFKFEIDRRRYVFAHGVLRSILASYLNLPPADLQFFLGSNGKPRLALGTAGERLEFNLSHSHAMSLVAVTRGREIGVDVEHVREDFAFDQVAGRFFTSQEVVALRALPGRLQRHAFYKCWTSKEAFLKGKGTGLSGELDEVEIILTAEEIVKIRSAIRNWSLVELSPCEGYVGALALEGPECQVKCFQWRQLTNKSIHPHA